MAELSVEIINLLVVIITGFIGLLTKSVMTYFKNKGLLTKLQNNKELASIIVKAVEQGYKDFNGQEKFEIAKDKLVEVTKDKKIKITESEIDLLIESVVKEMKEQIKNNK